MARRILVVDDDEALCRLMEGILASVGQCRVVPSGQAAIDLIPAWMPELILLDINMPGIDGYEVLRWLRSTPDTSGIHVIMVSARSSNEEQVKAIELGADDYLVKPFDALELRYRVALHFRLADALEEVGSIRKEIASRNQAVRELKEERTRQMAAAQDITVFALAKVAESRDETTGEHLLRIRHYSQVLAEALRDGPYADHIDNLFLNQLFLSSPLHDIGKIAIPDCILRKPGRLTAEEFEIVKQHTVIGANILDQAVFRCQCGDFWAMAAVVARFHHEKFDGTGYPAGLVQHEIPLPARIVAVADVFDALTSRRPYKEAMPVEEASKIILGESERHFDPVVVRAFQASADALQEVRQRYLDEKPLAVGAMAFADQYLHLNSGVLFPGVIQAELESQGS